MAFIRNAIFYHMDIIPHMGLVAVFGKKTQCFKKNNQKRTAYGQKTCPGQKSLYWGWSSNLLIGNPYNGLNP